MRISTQMLFQTGLNGILDQQARAARTLEQLSTGQRINRISDDPVDAARVQELERAAAQQSTYLDNISRTEQRLAIQESSLEAAGTVVRRVRELAVQAASDTTGEEGRRLIAVELRQRVQQLTDIGNQQNGEGEYIFAGAQSKTRPFAPAGGSVAYLGDSVQRELLIGPGTTIADGDTGDDVFMRIRNGDGVVAATPAGGNTGTGVIRVEPRTDVSVYDGSSFTIRFVDAENYEVLDASAAVVDTGSYEPGGIIGHNGAQLVITGSPVAGDEFAVTPAAYESAFDTVSRLADALEASATGDVARTAQRQAIDDALGQLDRTEARLLEVRASVGARLNTLEDTASSQEDARFSLQRLASEVRDLNYAEAASRLQQELFTLQASQQAFTRIQGNSLFNFI